MQVLLDYHYSDEWADGDKQIIPRAWATIESTEALAQAVYDYTLATLLELDGAGLLPELVQVGNETNPELMRGPDNGKEPIDWQRNAALLNAGIRGVRDAARRAGAPIKVMLHIAQPENVQPGSRQPGPPASGTSTRSASVITGAGRRRISTASLAPSPG
jgi:arabinogalactan endo-1,4-beta-galactosidase